MAVGIKNLDAGKEFFGKNRRFPSKISSIVVKSLCIKEMEEL